MIVLIAIFIFIISFLSFNHLKSKPLSEDDGNWYYLATFWSKGLRPYFLPKKDCNHNKYYDRYQFHYSMTSYFNLSYLFAIIYNYIIPKKLRVVHIWYYLKNVWYSLTVVSLFFLMIVNNQNYLLAILASMILLVILSGTRLIGSDLTYAEIYYLLPLTLSIIFAKLGIEYTSFFILISGVLWGLSFQFKITILPFMFIFLLCSISIFSLFDFFILIIGFVLLNALPILKIKLSDRKTKIHYKYLAAMLSPLVTLLNTFFKKQKITVIKENNYVKNNISKIKDNNLYKRLLFDFIVHLNKHPIFIALAMFQIVMIFINFDVFRLFWILSSFAWILVIFAQHQIYYPLYNSIWINISVLAGFTLSDFLNLNKNDTHSLSFLFFLFLIILESTKFLFRIRDEYKSKSILAQKPYDEQTLLVNAKNIADDIKNNSNEKDCLLVWGNHANLFIYSQRRSFYPGIFLYSNRIFNPIYLRNHFKFWIAPKLIFYAPAIPENYWNIDTINIKMRASYKILKQYPFTFKSNNCYLFKLDEELYQEILLEEAFEESLKISTLEYKKEDWILHNLNKILKINSLNICARYFLKVHSEKLTSKERIEYLLEIINEYSDSFNKSQILYLLGKEYFDINDFVKSETYIQDALSLNNEDFKIFNILGKIYFHKSMFKESIEFLKIANQKNPHSVEVYNNLAVVLHSIGDIEVARQCCKIALEYNEYCVDTINNAKALNLM